MLSSGQTYHYLSRLSEPSPVPHHPVFIISLVLGRGKEGVGIPRDARRADKEAGWANTGLAASLIATQ